MTCKSIGFKREDGTFQVLATFNNNDGHMTAPQFQGIVRRAVQAFQVFTEELIVVLDRQDAPDYVDLGEAK